MTEKLDKPLKMGKSLLNEFKEFIARGNVMNLAIGVIMGAAFGKITSTLVEKIVMPLIGLLLGGVDFSTLSVTLIGRDGGEVLLPYGLFIQSVVDFLITAIAIFIFIKILNVMTRKLEKKKEEAPPPPPPAPSKEELLLTEIRDLLAKQTESAANVRNA